MRKIVKLCFRTAADVGQRDQRTDRGSLQTWCSESGREEPSVMYNPRAFCNVISVPCLIFTVEQKEKKKKSNFSVVGRIGANWPLWGVGGLFLTPSGNVSPWAVFLAT